VLQPQEHKTLPETVYQQLREAILNGEFPPGVFLRQEDLARQLGVSRAPLREALPRLEAEGIVLLSPRRGYSVVSLGPDEIDELFDLRAMLESKVMYAATKKRTAEDVAKVRDLIQRMDQQDLKTPGGINTWFDLHAELHDAFLAPARFSHYQRVINSVRTAVESYIRCEFRMTGDADQAHAEHNEMLAVFEKGDAEEAARLVREHIENVAFRLKSALKNGAQNDG